MALDTFHVYWATNVLQSFFRDTTTHNAEPDSPIKHFFDWRQPSSRGGTSKPVGDRFKYLFYTTLDLPDEDEWRFERPMGKGSFGAAALFSRVNALQERTDSFVLKVTEANKFQLVPSQSKKQHLTIEAAIMAQINELNSENFVRLRQFKVDDKYCRYYTEFCQYGNLETLRMKYKAWNKHFPELFLWHVFHCLACAYLEMSRGPFRSMNNLDFGQIKPGQYLLHNDIKPENIFLAHNKANDSNTMWYPKPKIGDFGLATTTNYDELLRSQAKMLQRGTPCWMAPEQRLPQMLDLTKYHFYQDIHPSVKHAAGTSNKCHRIRPEANIWAIGAVMWNLMTMGEIDSLSEKTNNILHGSNMHARSFDGTNILKRADAAIRQRYSAKLWNLICECTKMIPGDRPPPSRLIAEIEAGLKHCMKQASDHFDTTGDTAPYKVAFEQNQINELADGGAGFDKYMHFWHDFADELLWTPRNWGNLCPPEAPRDLNFDVEGLPVPLRRRQAQIWEEALEERDRKQAEAAAAASAAHHAAAPQHHTPTPASMQPPPAPRRPKRNRSSDEERVDPKRGRMR